MANKRVVVKVKKTGTSSTEELKEYAKNHQNEIKNALANARKEDEARAIDTTKIPKQKYECKVLPPHSSGGATIFTAPVTKEEAEQIRSEEQKKFDEEYATKDLSPYQKAKLKSEDITNFQDIGDSNTIADKYPDLRRIWDMAQRGQRLSTIQENDAVLKRRFGKDYGINYLSKLRSDLKDAKAELAEEPHSERRIDKVNSLQNQYDELSRKISMKDTDIGLINNDSMQYMTLAELKDFMRQAGGLNENEIENLIHERFPTPPKDSKEITTGDAYEIFKKVPQFRQRKEQANLATQKETNEKVGARANPSNAMNDYLLHTNSGLKLLETAVPMYMQVKGIENEQQAKYALVKEIKAAAKKEFGEGGSQRKAFTEMQDQHLSRGTLDSGSATERLEKAVNNLFHPFVENFLRTYNNPNDRKGETPLIGAETSDLLGNKLLTQYESSEEQPEKMNKPLPFKDSDATFINEGSDAAWQKKQEEQGSKTGAEYAAAKKEWEEQYGDKYKEIASKIAVAADEDTLERLQEELSNLPTVDDIVLKRYSTEREGNHIENAAQPKRGAR